MIRFPQKCSSVNAALDFFREGGSVEVSLSGIEAAVMCCNLAAWSLGLPSLVTKDGCKNRGSTPASNAETAVGRASNFPCSSVHSKMIPELTDCWSSAVEDQSALVFVSQRSPAAAERLLDTATH